MATETDTTPADAQPATDATIVVDPEAVVDALFFNHYQDEAGRRVFCVPDDVLSGGRVRATSVYLNESETFDKKRRPMRRRVSTEGRPIHVHPKRFVGDDDDTTLPAQCRPPNLTEVAQEARRNYSSGETGMTEDEWVAQWQETAEQTTKENIRSALRDTVSVTDPTQPDSGRTVVADVEVADDA